MRQGNQETGYGWREERRRQDCWPIWLLPDWLKYFLDYLTVKMVKAVCLCQHRLILCIAKCMSILLDFLSASFVASCLAKLVRAVYHWDPRPRGKFLLARDRALSSGRLLYKRFIYRHACTWKFRQSEKPPPCRKKINQLTAHTYTVNGRSLVSLL